MKIDYFRGTEELEEKETRNKTTDKSLKMGFAFGERENRDNSWFVHVVGPNCQTKGTLRLGCVL